MTVDKKSFLLPGQSLEDAGVSMLIYGPAGVGKTSLVKTLLGWRHSAVIPSAKWKKPPREEDDFPGEPTDEELGFVDEPYCEATEILVLDVESGKGVLTKHNKLACTIVPVYDEDVKQFKDDMLPYLIDQIPEKMAFKFVFFDNISEYEKFLVLGLTKQRGKDLPDMREWGNASIYVRKHMRDLKQLTFKGVNVIFNFWDMVNKIKDQNGEIASEVVPKCMSDTWKEYVGIVDHYAYMGVATQKTDKFLPGDRYLQFEDFGMQKGKTRSKNIGKGVGKIEQANLADIFRRLK